MTSPRMTPDSLLQGLDYGLLREQKRRLLVLREWLVEDQKLVPHFREFPDYVLDRGGDTTTPSAIIGAISGLVHMIDAIQDCAEDSGYMTATPTEDDDA